MKKLTPARSVATAICAGTAAVALALSASPAFATTPPADSAPPEAVLAEVAPEVLDSLSRPEVNGDSVEYATESVATTVPLEPGEDIIIGREGQQIGIGLPFAENAQPVETKSDSIVAFDNGNGSDTASLLHDDGSVQITTILKDASAPSRYEYSLDVPTDATVAQDVNGLVTITGSDGETLGMIAPAWAKDSNGNAVNTWYEVNGDQITQVVEHDGMNSYPIVADPFMGIDMISSFKWVKSSQGYTISVAVTPWMGTVSEAIAGGYGWDELKTKVKKKSVTEFNRLNTVTMNQQWLCHAAGKLLIGVAGWLGVDKRPTWDLENWRKANPGYVKAVKSQCNW